VLHGGLAEGGLASGYEKFVMDADHLAMIQVLAKGVLRLLEPSFFLASCQFLLNLC
jgi:trimethylamine:corrinoid methyltransferase-like protein